MSQDKQIRIDFSGEASIKIGAQEINTLAGSRRLTWEVNQVLDDVYSDSSATFDATRTVVLDLAELEMIASVGLNELITINRSVRQRGARFVLSNVQDTVRSVLALTRLERMFDIQDSNLRDVKSEELGATAGS